MPIRINLLAEAKAAEELRRRDPVKRAILGAIIVVALVLGVWSWVFAGTIVVRSELSRYQSEYNSLTNQYSQVMSNQNRLHDVQSKLTMLHRYANARFLSASPLDALQRSTIDKIRLMRLSFEETFEVIPDVPASTNPDTGVHTAAKPGFSKEKVKLLLEAKDSSDNPGGEQIGRLQQALAATSYFQDEHISTNRIKLLKSDTPQYDNEARRPYVLFNLECQYADRIP